MKVILADSDHKPHQTGETECGEIDSYPGDIRDIESDASGHQLVEDPAVWLYELVFSSLEEKRCLNELEKSAREHEGDKDTTVDRANNHDTQCPEQNHRIDSFIQRRLNARDVVNELLSEWTHLPKRVINKAAFVTQTDDDSDYGDSDSSSGSSGSSSIVSVGGLGNPNDNPDDISLIDVRGRKYRIPWDVAKTWLVCIQFGWNLGRQQSSHIGLTPQELLTWYPKQ